MKKLLLVAGLVLAVGLGSAQAGVDFRGTVIIGGSSRDRHDHGYHHRAPAPPRVAITVHPHHRHVDRHDCYVSYDRCSKKCRHKRHYHCHVRGHRHDVRMDCYQGHHDRHGHREVCHVDGHRH